MTVSLEKCFVEVDDKKVPALDPSLIKQYNYLNFDLYTPYHIAITLLNKTPLDEQIKNRENYLKKEIENIKVLLQMNFATFWNFVLNRKEKKDIEIFNSKLVIINYIENYCRGCIEWMQAVKLNNQKEKNNIKEDNWEYIDMPDNICNLEAELSQYIFLLIIRLSFLNDDNKYNNNEISKENNCWSEASYESNMKTYNIFSIPFLFDFINLYYNANKKIVSEILIRLIKIHPKFNEDMAQSLTLTEKISELLIAQIEKMPILLISADDQFQQLLSAVEEVVNVYSVLLEHVNSSMKNILFAEPTLIKSLITLYQEWCSTPNDHIKENSSDIYHDIIEKFKKTVLNLVFIYLKLNFFDEVQKDKNEIDSIAQLLKDFLNEILDMTTMNSEDDTIKKSTYMENSLFIVDFDVTYGLVDEIKELNNNCKRISFKDTIKEIEFIISQSDNQDTRGSLSQGQGLDDGADDEYISRTILISQVQELFPDLGDGFIDECLKALNNNPETVIAKLLDDDLPANLKSINRTTKRKTITKKIPSEFTKPLPSQLEIMAEEEHKKITIDDILKERRNVFDNDEFDILRNGTIDMNKVILGKKNRGTFEKEFDDKSKVNKEQIKSIVNHYDMYDDEYDDTWDGINEFNVNIDNNGDDKDKNAEGDETEKTKKQDNKAEDSSDPGVVNKAVLMKWLENNPDVFYKNNRKSKIRKQLIDETGMSNEQIEGWYTMYQRNKKKREEAKNKSKGNKNNNSQASTPTPQDQSDYSEKNTDNNNHSRKNSSNTNNNSNNNHNRNRSNRNNNSNTSNTNKAQNNKDKNSNNNSNRTENNGIDNKNKNKSNDNNKNDTNNKGNNGNSNNNNRRNNNNSNKGGNKNKNKERDGEKGSNGSSSDSKKPYNKKRSDADNHYRKAGRQRKLNFMMGGFE